MTWIITWSEKGDCYWLQCYTRDDAERLYKAKVAQDCHEISLCEVKRSTDFHYQPEVSK